MPILPFKNLKPIQPFERGFVPLYPYAAVLGVTFFVTTLLFSEGWTKLLALVWVVAVPLWLTRWWVYRQDRS